MSFIATLCHGYDNFKLYKVITNHPTSIVFNLSTLISLANMSDGLTRPGIDIHVEDMYINSSWRCKTTTFINQHSANKKRVLTFYTATKEADVYKIHTTRDWMYCIT